MARSVTRVALAATIACATWACSSPTKPSPPEPLVIYQAGVDGVSLPTLVRQVKPKYTSAALANRIQGTVLLNAVVLADGTVGEVTVAKSLDTVYGLDDEAVAAAKQWLFNPGVKDGKPVAVRVIEMSFTIVG